MTLRGILDYVCALGVRSSPSPFRYPLDAVVTYGRGPERWEICMRRYCESRLSHRVEYLLRQPAAPMLTPRWADEADIREVLP